MILSLLPLLLQAAIPSIDGLPVGGLSPQTLPKQGCAAYLFSTGQTRTLAAVATMEPASLRIALDNAVVDLPRVEASGTQPLNIPSQLRYAAGEISATLDLTVEQRPNLNAGAAVPRAALRVDRTGKDTIVMPLAGLIGCAA